MSGFEDWYFNKHYAGTTAKRELVFEKLENLKGSESKHNGRYINSNVELSSDAWNHQQARIDELERENKRLKAELKALRGEE